jgi:hypothetical protein
MSTWQPPSPDIDAFLTEYDRRSADPDANSAELYADTFLVLDPNNAMALARATFAAALPARRQLFAKAGIGEVQRRETRQLDLDRQHVLVRADWDAHRAGNQPVRLESTFLLRRDDDGIRIVAYLNHHDVTARLSG